MNRRHVLIQIFFAVLIMFAGLATDVIASPLDTLQPGQWYEAPDSNLSTLDPCLVHPCTWSGSDGQAHIMGAWNGGAYDTTRNRLIIWGGGHNNYGGNEIYTFDIATMKWTMVIGPSKVPTQDRADCFPAGVAGCTGGSNDSGYYSDGKPASRHTSNALAYAANADQFFSLALGSSFGSTGRQGFQVDSFNFNTKTWKSDWQRSPGNPYGADGTVAAYHSGTGKIWYHASYNSPLAEFDPLATGGIGKWTSYRSDYVEINSSILIDTKRDRLVLMGRWGPVTNPRQFLVWDLKNPSADPTSPATAGTPNIPILVRHPDGTTSTTTVPIDKHTGVGFIYDPIGDRYIAWNGGTTVHALNPDTWVWGTVPLHPGNTVTPPPLANEQGTYGRMQYIPSKQAFVVVNETNQNVYFFKLAPGSTPIPTVTLTASALSLPADTAATLTWSSANATRCTASGAWAGALETAGTQSTGALTTTSNYTIACTGPGGSATASVTITVDGTTVGPGTSLPPTSPDTSASADSGGGALSVWEWLCLLAGRRLVMRSRHSLGASPTH